MEKLDASLNSNETVGSSSDKDEQVFLTWEEHKKKLEDNIAAAEYQEEGNKGENLSIEKEERIESIRSTLKDLAISMEGSEDEPELVEFGTIKIPKELLSEEKVIVNDLKERSRFDIVGRKRDEKILEHLLYDDISDEDKLRKSFTPTVAKAYLDKFRADPVETFFSDNSVRLFEALPLEVQLEELSKKDSIKFLKRQPMGLFVNKVACGVISNLENENDPSRRIAKDELESEIIRHRTRRGAYGNATKITDILDDSVSQSLFDATVKCGVSKIDSAAAFLKDERFFDQIDDFVDDNITVEYAQIANKIIYDFYNENGEDNKDWVEAYERAFPPGVRKLEEIGGVRYGDFTEEESSSILEELETTKDIREKIGLPESLWDSFRNTKPFMYEQIKAQKELGEETLAGLKSFIESGWLMRESGKIEYLDDVKDINKVFISTARELIEKGDYERGRELIGQYAFGMDINELVKDLTSIGVVKRRKDEYDSDVVAPGEGKIKIDNLSVLGELSKEQELVTLEAIALYGCKDSDLIKKLDIYERNGFSSKERNELKSVIEKAVSEVSEKTTDIFSEYMQEKIDTSAREIDKIRYGDKNIPLFDMESGDFMLLIHRLGAFSKKMKENPGQWNDESFADDGKKGIGYISTSAIAGGNLRLANITKEKLGERDEVFYAFSKLGKGSIKSMCEVDAHTRVAGKMNGGYEKEYKISTLKQDYFYSNPKVFLKANAKAAKESWEGYRHNEVVLDRYSGDPNENGGRLQPSYIVVFVDDPSKIGDLPKKHAAYFGTPIMMIDPNKYS